MDKNTLKSTFGAPLVAQGFKRKRNHWYRQTEGALQVVNLQQSPWSVLFYVNLALVPAGMHVEGMPTPKVEYCPIMTRLDSVFPQEKKPIGAVFDLDLVSMDDADRAQQIVAIVEELVPKFMRPLESTADFSHALEDGHLKGVPVALTAQKHLGIDLNKAAS